MPKIIHKNMRAIPILKTGKASNNFIKFFVELISISCH